MRSAFMILTRSSGFIVATSIFLTIVTSSRFIVSINNVLTSINTTCSTTLNFVLNSLK